MKLWPKLFSKIDFIKYRQKQNTFKKLRLYDAEYLGREGVMKWTPEECSFYVLFLCLRCLALVGEGQSIYFDPFYKTAHWRFREQFLHG
jgi:hypothetical protein